MKSDSDLQEVETTIAALAAEWRATLWRGERAHQFVTAQWRAVVSVERGRLVHFGPAGTGTNLLLETESPETALTWGGHLVWLGPQALWVWPPPEAWERAAAERVAVNRSRLELLMPDAGRGFPRLTRIYEVAGERLACRVVIAGGTQAVQVMQVLQSRPDTVVELRPGPSAQWPRGYIRVGGAVGPIHQPDFPLPAGVEEREGTVRISYTGKCDKLAFPPQTLVARIGASTLLLAFGESRGTECAAPDFGFYTQVYIGDPNSPVVEIEQFSPQWQPGESASCSMYVALGAEGEPLMSTNGH